MDHYKTILGYKIISNKDWAAIEKAISDRDARVVALQNENGWLRTRLEELKDLKTTLHCMMEHYNI